MEMNVNAEYKKETMPNLIFPEIETSVEIRDVPLLIPIDFTVLWLIALGEIHP